MSVACAGHSSRGPEAAGGCESRGDGLCWQGQSGSPRQVSFELGPLLAVLFSVTFVSPTPSVCSVKCHRDAVSHFGHLG